MTLLALLKRMAKHFMVLDNFCHRCGRKVAPWNASDALWKRVVKGRWEILCWNCFYGLMDDELRDAYALVVWHGRRRVTPPRYDQTYWRFEREFRRLAERGEL